jgi:hypothetical protein
MANNKDFKVKNGIQPTVYNEGVGTVVSGSESSFSSIEDSGKSFTATQGGLFYSQVYIKPDGTKMYLLDGSDEAIHQYSLSTAFDISTASYDTNKTKDITGYGSNHKGLFFKPDGTQVFTSEFTTIRSFSLTTPWDISTLTFSGNKSKSIGGSQNRSLYIKSDGSYIYWAETSSDVIYQSEMTTAWDINTAQAPVSFSVSSQDTAPLGITFSPDGLTMLVSGSTNDSIYRYSLSTAFDVTTATYDNYTLDFSSVDSQPYSLFSGDNGTKLYIMGTTTDTVYQYSTVQTTASLDLSTGAVFDYTPTSDVQVTVSNPAASGTVSAATLLLNAEDAAGVTGIFDTTTWSGNGSTQTITNNVDLATDGGMVWIKQRNTNQDNVITDTERGAGYRLNSNSTSAQDYDLARLSSFNSDGFSIGDNTTVNNSSGTYVGWTFKKAAKFFDIVTYTGNGATQDVSHSLGSDVGMLIIRSTSAGNWFVWHRSLGDNAYLFLNGTNTQQLPGFDWIDVTSTTISLQNNSSNTNGETFVAYLFAHDTASDGLIQCGSFVNDSSSVNVEVNLGWEPQWLLIKGASSGSGLGHWYIYDNSRTGQVLSPNQSAAEVADTSFTLTSNGFTPTTNFGGTLVYTAIRNPYIPTITYDTDLEWSGGTAPTAPAEGETDVITISTRDGGTTYQASQAIDGAK